MHEIKFAKTCFEIYNNFKQVFAHFNDVQINFNNVDFLKKERFLLSEYYLRSMKL